VVSKLREMGFSDPEAAYGNLMLLRDGPERSHFPENCRHLLRQIAPDLLANLKDVADPDAVLVNLERFISRVGARASYYSMLAGSPEAEMVPELEPEKGDHRLYKRRYSAFYATGLDALLRELKVNTVVLTGVLTNICIQHTAADAYFRGYRVVVPTDCVNALTPEDQETSLAFMGRMYNAMLTDSCKAEEMLEASR